MDKGAVCADAKLSGCACADAANPTEAIMQVPASSRRIVEENMTHLPICDAKLPFRMRRKKCEAGSMVPDHIFSNGL
jgi:hypothetical protein